MSMGSTYTWSAKNGGRKRLSPRWENGQRKRSERLTSDSFWTNLFSFGQRCSWHGANSLSKDQTELVILTTQNVRTKSPLAQVGWKQCDYVYMNIFVWAYQLTYLNMSSYLILHVWTRTTSQPRHPRHVLTQLCGNFLIEITWTQPPCNPQIERNPL